MLWYLEQFLNVPAYWLLLAVLRSRQVSFVAADQDLRGSSFPALDLLNRGRNCVHYLAVCLLRRECAVGNLPVHWVVRSQSVGHKRVVYALLLAHQLEELSDVPLNLSLLLHCCVEHLLVLRRRVRGPRHLQLRLRPWQVSFFPSFGSGLWVGHVRLRSAVTAVFLVRRQPLRKEVPRVAVYLIELLENDVLRLCEDLLQRHILYLLVLKPRVVLLHLDRRAAHLSGLLRCELIHSAVALRVLRVHFRLRIAHFDQIVHCVVGIQMHLVDWAHF